ncbi:MAG: hypothetical protein ABI723_07745 [Bacteroidia bacterium]
MKNEEFYIGYLPQAPDKTSNFIRNILIGIFLLLVSGGIFLALHQQQFSNAMFEYGSNKEYTGVYTNVPVPSIRIINQKDSTGKIFNLTIPIVGYGKHGAESAIEKFEKENAVSLKNKLVTFKGDLLYGDGKTLLSLNNETPIIRFTNTNETANDLQIIGDTILQGEIIDPKCYFGVMKPGRGKVHRECAIRCISGGIPPVFRTHRLNGEYEYFLLLGKNGEHINQQVLPFVADHIALKGKIFQWGDWKVVEEENISRPD